MIDTFDPFGPGKQDEHIRRDVLDVVEGNDGSEILKRAAAFYHETVASLSVRVADNPDEADFFATLHTRSERSMRLEAGYKFGHDVITVDEAKTYFITEVLEEIIAAAMVVYNDTRTTLRVQHMLMPYVSGLYQAGLLAAKTITDKTLSDQAGKALEKIRKKIGDRFSKGATIH